MHNKISPKRKIMHFLNLELNYILRIISLKLQSHNSSEAYCTFILPMQCILYTNLSQIL